MEFSLYDLYLMIKKNLVTVIMASICSSFLMGLASYTLLDDSYTSSASLYILMKESVASQNVTYADMNASQMLVNDISDLAFTDRVQSSTCKNLGLESLDDYSIKITGEADSRVLLLSVTGPDPQLSSNIANELIKSITAVATEVMNIDSVNVIDYAKVPNAPSGPNHLKNIIFGFIAGFFLSVMIVVCSTIFNIKISHFNKVNCILDLPVIGYVPSSKSFS